MGEISVEVGSATAAPAPDIVVVCVAPPIVRVDVTVLSPPFEATAEAAAVASGLLREAFV